MFHVIGNTNTHILLGVSFFCVFTVVLFESTETSALPAYPIKGLEEILGVACMPLGAVRAPVGGAIHTAVLVNSILKVVQRTSWVREPVGLQREWWAWTLSFLQMGKCKWQASVMVCSVISHAHLISAYLTPWF